MFEKSGFLVLAIKLFIPLILDLFLVKASTEKCNIGIDWYTIFITLKELLFLYPNATNNKSIQQSWKYIKVYSLPWTMLYPRKLETKTNSVRLIRTSPEIFINAQTQCKIIYPH